jgi:hypothetical protein
LNADQICLTLPGDDAFHSVAHLVLGGLAVRLDLSFEHLEDLELALDTLLERSSPGENVNVRVVVGEGELRTSVGPLDSIRSELERDGTDNLSLGRILGAVCDSVSIEDREGGEWVELTKRVTGAKGLAS